MKTNKDVDEIIERAVRDVGARKYWTRDEDAAAYGAGRGAGFEWARRATSGGPEGVVKTSRRRRAATGARGEAVELHDGFQVFVQGFMRGVFEFIRGNKRGQ